MGGASTKTRGGMAAWVVHDGKFWRSDETEGRIHIRRPDVDWDSSEGIVEVRCRASLPLVLALLLLSSVPVRVLCACQSDVADV
jgi:hypothetical protein